MIVQFTQRVLYRLKSILDTKYHRLLNIPIIIVYTLLGAGTYFLISKKLNLFDEVFGKEFMDKIMSKIKR